MEVNQFILTRVVSTSYGRASPSVGGLSERINLCIGRSGDCLTLGWGPLRSGRPAERDAPAPSSAQTWLSQLRIEVRGSVRKALASMHPATARIEGAARSRADLRRQALQCRLSDSDRRSAGSRRPTSGARS